MSEAVRSNLIESHRSYAHAIAAEVLKKLPPHAERDELQAAAELGLVEAAGSFDSSRGVQFKTFAYYRIRGAVYDAIRKATWLSKTEYDKVRFEAAANSYMSDYADGEASTGTPAQELAEVGRITDSLSVCYLMSLEAEGAPTPEDPSAGAEDELLDRERTEMVRAAIAQLPEKNRAVIEGYYLKGETLEEAGKKLGLSKSWTSRVHAKSIEMLRKLVAESFAPAAAS